MITSSCIHLPAVRRPARLQIKYDNVEDNVNGIVNVNVNVNFNVNY